MGQELELRHRPPRSVSVTWFCIFYEGIEVLSTEVLSTEHHELGTGNMVFQGQGAVLTSIVHNQGKGVRVERISREGAVVQTQKA